MPWPGRETQVLGILLKCFLQDPTFCHLAVSVLNCSKVALENAVPLGGGIASNSGHGFSTLKVDTGYVKNPAVWMGGMGVVPS